MHIYGGRSLRRLSTSSFSKLAMSSPTPYDSDPELAQLHRELEERRRVKAAAKKAAAEAEVRRAAEEVLRKRKAEEEAAKEAAARSAERKRPREDDSESEIEEVEAGWVAARYVIIEFLLWLLLTDL